MDHQFFSTLVSHFFVGAKLQKVERLVGGVSADVHRLDLLTIENDQYSVVLRVHGASHSGHDALLEYQLLQALYRVGVPVAEPLFLDHSCSLIDNPFIIMRYVSGSSAIPKDTRKKYIESMANKLVEVHSILTDSLPTLPSRLNPLPEVFDYLPEGAEWQALRAQLRTMKDTDYKDIPKLLHGDF